ncbi:membrane lipoprotein lipid attachment site-containing protein [Castellaniella ginsengisoli]|jgi:hypothetical protein|uniref:Membrane lipoprotein lipid attachment site-containing protein n=1 Tax=Castellaniella ginsengisoli TaxID=546114 RepID=A0AB39END3_9BURK
MKKIILAAMATVILAGCDTDANMASRNLSRAADQFEISRRVVFYNGINGEYLLSIEGLCSIKADGADKQLEVTCKTGPSEFKKHFLGLSDNVTYFAEQLNGADVSTYHYRVIFKPQTILPDVDFRGSTNAIRRAVTPDSKD